MTRPRAGFSLLEMLAVVALMALMTALAAMSLKGQRQHATMQGVLQQVLEFDRSVRLQMRRSAAPAKLILEIDGLALRSPENWDLRSPLTLPDGYIIDNVWRAGDGPGPTPLVVRVGVAGRSDTYGFCLRGPQGQARWILIAGLSGQQQVADDEHAFADIQATLQRSRL